MKILLFISSDCSFSIKMLRTMEKLGREFPEVKLEIFDILSCDDGIGSLMRQYGITILPSLVIEDIVVEGFQLIKPLRTLLKKKRNE
jgi:glutaredoxin